MITMDLITDIVCEHYKVPVKCVLSIDHTPGARKYAEPRHYAMYLCRLFNLGSQSAVGKMFGGRDHATVNHAEKRVNNEISLYLISKKALEGFIEEIHRREKDPVDVDFMMFPDFINT
jgi:chromosomal replication initiator protein